MPVRRRSLDSRRVYRCASSGPRLEEGALRLALVTVTIAPTRAIATAEGIATSRKMSLFAGILGEEHLVGGVLMASPTDYVGYVVGSDVRHSDQGTCQELVDLRTGDDWEELAVS